MKTIELERLILRSFELSDAKEVRRLAGDRAISDTTQNVPYPYEDGMAEAWIATHKEKFEKEISYIFAVVLKTTNELIGAISLEGRIKAFNRAELGYWIGKDFWGKGYCTEAAAGIIRFGFEELELNKVTSRYKTMNPASGKVMYKNGFKDEGILRDHTFKNGEYCDVQVTGLLRREYEGQK